MTAAPRITEFIRAGLRFPVRDSGPADGAAVLLLHGFPQNGESWGPVARLLNDAGYRTLVPDQRGYCPQASPAGRRNYRIGELTDDAVALIEQAGLGPVHLVGHDWGAAVAWSVAAARPDLLRSLTAVSVPHPAAFLWSMLRSRQLLKSWYMLAFQLPRLPERLIRNETGLFRRGLERTGQSPQRALRDIRLLQRGDTATAALNWYRALPAAIGALRTAREPISVPTLQVWSDGDTALARSGHELSRRFVKAPWQLVTLPGVSHWIPEEAPDTLARLIETHAAAV